jgi:hypothetical protein
MAMTAANTQPVQTQQVQGAPASASMLLQRGKKKKPHEPAEDAKHWSQTKPATADMLMRRNK